MQQVGRGTIDSIKCQSSGIADFLVGIKSVKVIKVGLQALSMCLLGVIRFVSSLPNCSYQTVPFPNRCELSSEECNVNIWDVRTNQL